MRSNQEIKENIKDLLEEAYEKISLVLGKNELLDNSHSYKIILLLENIDDLSNLFSYNKNDWNSSKCWQSSYDPTSESC